MKTINDQLDFVNKIKTLIAKKIKPFSKLPIEERYVKAQDILKQFEIQYNNTGDTITKINELKENNEDQEMYEPYYDKLYKEIDLLFLYSYLLPSYTSVIPLDDKEFNALKTQMELYISYAKKLFKDLNYLIYYNIFYQTYIVKGILHDAPLTTNTLME